jgi:RNA polymerase sigma-70 factor (ECF subfamily)
VSAIVDAFLAGANSAEPEAGLETQLAEAVARARAAWPDVALGEERFAAVLGSKIEPGESPLRALAQLHVEDLYLAAACQLGEEGAVRRFVTEHLAQVPKYVARISTNPQVADEVQQDLAQRLLLAGGDQAASPPKIASYNGRGPLDGWLAVSAQRSALNLVQRQRLGVPDPRADLERALTESPDPELQVVKAELKGKFEEAMRAALRELSPRDRLLLRLSVVSGLSVRKLGEMHGVHASTAARWIERIRDQVLSSIQGALEATRGIDRGDLPSLVGLVRSRLELSLSGLLADAARDEGGGGDSENDPT